MRPEDTAMASGEFDSDTPLTDYAEYEITPAISRMLFGEQARIISGVVTADHARAIERENADLRQQLATIEARTIERCAAIAMKHWQEGNSLRDSQVAGKIMREIRAILKGKDNEQ